MSTENDSRLSDTKDEELGTDGNDLEFPEEVQPLVASGSEKAKVKAGYDPELQEFGGKCEHKFEIGQVTIRLPLDQRPVPMLALVLSFVPWVLPLVVLTDLICQQHFISFFTLVLMTIGVVLSEAVLKPMFNQPRPETTAVRYPDGTVKPGMPSGHVLNTHTIVTFLALEAPFHFDSLLTAFFIVVLLLCLSGACAWARVANGDHTVGQVSASFVIGTALGLVGFLVDVFLFQGNWPGDRTNASFIEVTNPSLRGSVYP